MDQPSIAGEFDAGVKPAARPKIAPLKSPDEFPSTVWKGIEQLRDSNSDLARAALTQLCKDYWQPVYAFIRRKGNDPDRAADLTQDFFTLLIEQGALAQVDPRKGKFRSFLMAACSHFLSNRRVYEHALKRGGGKSPVSIDRLKAEKRLRCEPFHEMTPERIFLRHWAVSTVKRVMDQLRSEVSLKSRSRVFDQIRPVLLERGSAPSYARIAADLGVGESTIKVTVHRFRARFRELLRAEIARTASSPDDIEDEISSLIEALTD
jgi:RNA polymerase sigma-70 factor (ECF subfamily)